MSRCQVQERHIGSFVGMCCDWLITEYFSIVHPLPHLTSFRLPSLGMGLTVFLKKYFSQEIGMSVCQCDSVSYKRRKHKEEFSQTTSVVQPNWDERKENSIFSYSNECI